MAPRNKYSREEMIEAAVHVVREKGIDALTAKAVAAELGVSTQPVFTCFHTIEEAKREVRAAAERIYDRYIAEGLQMQPKFYGVGMQYIRFAKEEPELYRLMFLTANEEGNNSFMGALQHSQDLVRESLQEIYHMDAPTADRYFRDLWLVVHGLATLIVSGECEYSEQEIGTILTGFSLSICKAIKEIPGFVDGTFDRDSEFRKLLQ